MEDGVGKVGVGPRGLLHHAKLFTFYSVDISERFEQIILAF